MATSAQLRLGTVLAGFALALTCLVPAPAPATTGPATTARAAKPQAVLWNLDAARVKPRRIFTAYNTSPYLSRLRWKHWGKRRAVAKGIWVSECGYCYPKARYKAKVRLTGFVTCKRDPSVRTYRRAFAFVRKPDGDHTPTKVNLYGGCP